MAQLTISQLWDLYNAIMANAYPGDENAVLDELERRGAV